ncbi:putative baseplate assembly protein [Anabaena azotica]|uniref:putative baseplate assembly protein n=1 Tax=Anabaena azotica TaxID=197653 RepID=UPI0039A6FE4D
MNTQYQNFTNQPGIDQRREKVRTTRGADGKPVVNGIDYVEVLKDRQTVSVHFIYNLPGEEDGVPSAQPLTRENVVIQGTGRSQSLSVESVTTFANILVLKVNEVNAYSYTLFLVNNLGDGSQPPSGFDPLLSQVEFSFQVNELSEFDLKTKSDSPREAISTPPVIDYLAKDYASFRQLMLDRLTVTMPKWQERNPADLGMMLVELLAYAGDRLSYYQDAVATEAYLGTARKRVSIRRHARLLDYPMHDGCNARTWVTLQVNSQGDGKVLLGAAENRPGIRLLTRTDELSLDNYAALIQQQVQVFETMHDITLYQAHNEIEFYTWGNAEEFLPYYLATGATQATLKNNQLKLQVGDVLIFEEVLGTESGIKADANPQHRHAVRLTYVKPSQDKLLNQDIVEVQWHQEDALPFDLVICTVVNGKRYTNVTVARGNVVLVDHGCTVKEELPEVTAGNRYRPRLEFGPLTHQGFVRLSVRELYTKDIAINNQGCQYAFDPTAPASVALRWELGDVRPQIWLEEQDDEIIYWRSQRDLLNSDSSAREFVVETEDDERAYLRFGDNVLGKKPTPETDFSAIYRIGNGTIGNVGADAIVHLDPQIPDLASLITQVRNPLPAKGGIDPEPIEQVRLYAPQAFRTQKRAVTASDYADVAQLYPGVRKAVATRRWTGNWYTIFITVDREANLPVDDTFKDKLGAFLERYRLAAQDVAIEAPIFVPLDIVLDVQVATGYFASNVQEELQTTTFSNQILPDGKLGFFHPDNFSFGQPVYLSQVIAAAMQVPGVVSVNPKRFQRWGQPPQNELQTGKISFGRLEIAIVDNDPNAPQNGRIAFEISGGLG